MSHPILTTLSDQEIELELLESRHCLEERLQRPVDFFCYPNGSYDKRAYQVVKKTYRAAVTTESGAAFGPAVSRVRAKIVSVTNLETLG